MILLSLLIVVTDPYKDIDYNEINVYELEHLEPKETPYVYQQDDSTNEPEEEDSEILDTQQLYEY